MTNKHGTKNKWGNWLWCPTCQNEVAWVDVYYKQDFRLKLFCNDECEMAWNELHNISSTPKVELVSALELLEKEPNPDLELVKALLWLALPLGFRFSRRLKKLEEEEKNVDS